MIPSVSVVMHAPATDHAPSMHQCASRPSTARTRRPFVLHLGEGLRLTFGFSELVLLHLPSAAPTHNHLPHPSTSIPPMCLFGALQTSLGV